MAQPIPPLLCASIAPLLPVAAVLDGQLGAALPPAARWAGVRLLQLLLLRLLLLLLGLLLLLLGLLLLLCLFLPVGLLGSRWCGAA